ncbi:helix-turn-helix domain-containing protein [Larsenimonas rhizosphaerae]|uniref:Helix-turn-helix domain-containing protein n=1 Tax=Larsenimonas rhizosphaerae TaxID=2944682 RepID=A0AA42CYF4_9GAMM|nr:helix-turn-helix domain-containing protein [Larsenimonas rhizosphaerae]MCM2131530.1 helix-turn-helix domain-containing protein [Larsenimonas rhizosphaerae]MCX2525143.1 helix-turn-helix domain-containing protein [Larsenimonas rhizosphaerae]
MNRPDEVPVFSLYGERLQWPVDDLLHCESIFARSRLHDFNIRAHRHMDLMHVLLLDSGPVSLGIDQRRHQHDGPLLIRVPPLAVHHFRFSAETRGHILTLSAPMIARLRQRLPEAAGWLDEGGWTALSPSSPVLELRDEIRREFEGRAHGRETMMDTWLCALIGKAWRLDMPRRQARRQPASRAEQHLAQFQHLIDARFRARPTITVLAQEMGISASHLNALCIKHTGRSALALLNERTLLEARRELTYTSMSITLIAEQLGFDEPGYFARFFKRYTGTSPSRFRQRG